MKFKACAASAALDLIAFSPKKAALLVGKTLKSAIANAENNNELRVDTLVVKEATVGEGPTMSASRAALAAAPARSASAPATSASSSPTRSRSRSASVEVRAKKKAQAGRCRQATAARARRSVPATEGQARPRRCRDRRPGPARHQANEGPGETAAAPKLSSDEDTTKD